MAALARRVDAAAPQLRIRAAYLDHHGPTIAETAEELTPGGGGAVVVVPVLLSRAFHARVDIPAAARELGELTARRVLVAGPLGPDPALGQAVGELLDGRPETRVLVYLAGSSRTEAIADLVAALHFGLPGGRGYAFATLDEHLPLGDAIDRLRQTRPRTDATVAGIVGVAAMIAEGILRDRMVQRCRDHGIPFADGVLADTDALAALILRRVHEAIDADDHARE